jgi:GNAT superfamily N-acetyltransferase
MLRKAEVDDIPRMLEILVAGLQQVAQPGQRFPTAAEMAPGWHEWLTTPGPQHCVVWEEDGRILGLAGTEDAHDADASGVGEVVVIFVDPATQRRGIGSRLMAAIVAGLADRGMHEAVLWCLAQNTVARRFYEHEGWTLDRGPEPRPDSVGLEVRYRRRLGA